MTRFLSVFIFILFITSCDGTNDRCSQLINENTILYARIDSLRNTLNELSANPEEMINRAKQSIGNKEYDNARITLLKLTSRYNGYEQMGTARKLLRQADTKIEEEAFGIAESNNDIPSYNYYLKAYPKGKFVAKAKRNIRKLQASPTTHRSTYTKKHEPRGIVRVGAICCDGSRSYATGRGACSHHGGVCEWLYQ